MSQNGNYDFSCLPDVVLVKIFQYLNIEERFRASSTCSRLYRIFNHPTVWRSVHIHILATQSLYRDCDPVIPRRYYTLILKFGKYFKELTIKVTGYARNFPKEWNDVLSYLAQTGTLKVLHLEFGTTTSVYHLRSGKRPSNADISPLLSLISNSVKLNSCHIWSWPTFPAIFNNKKLNILKALMNNPGDNCIERLTLFGGRSEEWTERAPLLPSPNVTVLVINFFRNLTHLGIRSPMFNKDVIVALSSAGRSHLKHLHIYMNFYQSDSDFKIPEIFGRRWVQLKTFNPGVTVEVSILTKIPNKELFRFLKPETPIAAVNLRKYSTCNSELFGFIVKNYSNQLHQFVAQSDLDIDDEELINLAELSSDLEVLVYRGILKRNTVNHIKRIPRRKWQILDLCC